MWNVVSVSTKQKAKHDTKINKSPKYASHVLNCLLFSP